MPRIIENVLLRAITYTGKVFMLIDEKACLPECFCIYNASMTP
jgi:hypothetical protein